jgi:hypothetical protein
MTDNLPEPDEAPWLNLSQEEINQLRDNKKELTSYAKERIEKFMLIYDDALRRLAE